MAYLARPYKFPTAGIDFFDKASKLQYDGLVQMKDGIQKLQTELQNALKERDSLLGIVSHLHAEKTSLAEKIDSLELVIKDLKQLPNSTDSLLDKRNSRDESLPVEYEFENDTNCQDVDISNEIVKVEIIDEDNEQNQLHHNQAWGSHEDPSNALKVSSTRLTNIISPNHFSSQSIIVTSEANTISQICRDNRDGSILLSTARTQIPDNGVRQGELQVPTSCDKLNFESNKNQDTHDISIQPEDVGSANVKSYTKKCRRMMGKRNHVCDYCGKGFNNARDLKTHVRIHTNEKPYQCNYCARSFAQAGHLLGHIRTHTGDRPYKCAQCGLCFARSDSLRRHTRTHTGEKPYKCELCHKPFTELRSLKDHVLLHSGEKPYACSICGKKFTRSISLRRHQEHRCGLLASSST